MDDDHEIDPERAVDISYIINMFLATLAEEYDLCFHEIATGLAASIGVLPDPSRRYLLAQLDPYAAHMKPYRDKVVAELCRRAEREKKDAVLQ